MKLRLGFSPCPNDTFLFHALLHKLVEGPKVHWEPHMEDVESLNQLALTGQLDVTKLSFHAYAYCAHLYQLLNTGSALGFGCGPLLIARSFLTDEQIRDSVIAIPGELTTAHFLFKMAYPEAKNTRTIVFSDIENAILNEEVDAGVIIHENRFTYMDKGLIQIKDLGAYWEEKTGLPIPLGGIFVRRDLSLDLKLAIEQAIGESVRFGWAHPEASTDFIRCHAQEMAPDVIRQHIQLYVNAFTEDLGQRGREAVTGMYGQASDLHLIPAIPESIFLAP